MIFAVLLAVALGVLVYGRMSWSEASRDASIFDNASRDFGEAAAFGGHVKERA